MDYLKTPGVGARAAGLASMIGGQVLADMEKRASTYLVITSGGNNPVITSGGNNPNRAIQALIQVQVVVKNNGYLSCSLQLCGSWWR